MRINYRCTHSSIAPSQLSAPSPVLSTSTAVKSISIKCALLHPDTHTASMSQVPSNASSTSTHQYPSLSQKKNTAQNEEIVSMHAANPRRTRKTSYTGSLASSKPRPQRIDSSPQFTNPIQPGPSSSPSDVRKTSTAGISSEAKLLTYSGIISAMSPSPVVKSLKIPRKSLVDAGDRPLSMRQELRMSLEETSQEEVTRKEKKKLGIKKQSALAESEEELIHIANSHSELIHIAKVDKSADGPETKIISLANEEVKRSESSLEIKAESQICEPKCLRIPPMILLTEETQLVKPAAKKQPSLKKSRSRESDKLEFAQPGKKAKVIQNIDIEGWPLSRQRSKSALIPPSTSIDPNAAPAKHDRKQSKPRRIASAEITDECRKEEKPSQMVPPIETSVRSRKPSGSIMKKKESLTEAFGKEFHIGNTEPSQSDFTTSAFALDESNMSVEPMEEEGDDVWICPVCSVAYVDGAADMVGCDGGCDRWFHWHCVGIMIAPPEDKQWYCYTCNKKKKNWSAKKTEPVSKSRKKGH
ncbi:PHD-finger domain-containing protein [Ditylenchus destructor]|uniref:PHD-finger domain-containing protein n=1 Tax=Ditylenchus destructor TaxID=166010 RepID=A0AAD4N582_9BILA|nr:PHD-finger domain-containing protein [Ditylenchus destructor]